MKNNKNNKKLVKLHKLATLISRLTLGSIFIYSGIYKAANPQTFSRAIEYLNIFSNSLVDVITYTFPWIELIIGILLITGIQKKKVALGSVMLLIIFISITILNSFKGNLVPCGCFPESSILSSSNPLISTARNYILLMFGGIIIVANKDSKISSLVSIKKRFFNFTIFALIAFFLSILLISIATIRFEKKYVSTALNTRHLITENNKNLIGMQLPELKLRDSKGWILFKEQVNERYSVLLILDSLDCKFCIDEAVFFEKLNDKFGRNIKFYAVVGHMSRIAISIFKKKYSLNYPFLHDLNSQVIDKFTISSAAIKVLVSPDEEIIHIDPLTYSIKSIQKDFESKLKNIENGG